MSLDITQLFGKVAVLMGGLSAEREISLQSGNAVLTALKNSGVDAHGIDVNDNIVNELSNGNRSKDLKRASLTSRVCALILSAKFFRSL